MEPIMNTEEAKRHYQEILANAEHEHIVQQFVGNPSEWVVRGLSGLGGILIVLVAMGLWFG
jgi:hypothetical protein